MQCSLHSITIKSRKVSKLVWKFVERYQLENLFNKLNEHESCTNRDEIFLSVGITLEQEFKAQKFNLNSYLKSLKLNSYWKLSIK